ncbi:hypothetical protein ACI3LY_004419 [Candidozyma auris]|uniref:Zn(2)-C6 fungal-type domain-containing protein n=2 Tax=Candidozyma auris TaxID=498019 RepID=A0A2H0ZDP4_CANAR|nr:hypothetical_protein [[Candida] auris]PIS48462.1 hypothetical protein B9J08_005155 [[Candida] auris]PIS49075.1 hypothetical protein CJI97_005239 [[Candida] auris]QEO23055.1 hypothetical_protein [[Candida] auris]QWW24763.1 hypothetical protein CA7LBN_003620 [[Candida] auris]GBL49102.1 hypothetical protein CAJCM15448_13760 [[Candida] auris]
MSTSNQVPTVKNEDTPSQPQPPPRPRKRNRSTKVCRRCRAKKSKCDLQQPCSQCVKSGCAELCEYQKPQTGKPAATNGSSSTSQIKQSPPSVKSGGSVSNGEDNSLTSGSPNSINNLQKHLTARTKAHMVGSIPVSHTSPPTSLPSVVLEENEYLIGVNPIVGMNDLINFHMDFSELPSGKDYKLKRFTGLKRTARPLMFIVLSQQEPGARLFWKYEESCSMKLITITTFPKDMQQRTIEDVKRLFGEGYIPSFQEIAAAGGSLTKRTRKLISQYGFPLAITFTKDFHESDPILVSLRKVLPPKLSVVALMRRFFRKLYAHYPIIDESWTYAQIDRIVQYSPDGQVVDNVNLQNREDLAVLAYVLIILRLSYMSQFSNVREQNEAKLRMMGTFADEEHFSMQFPITIDAIELASNFLQKARSPLKTSFVVLQASIFMCVYRSLALESEAGCNTMATIENCGNLTQMAISLALDRDPDSLWDPMDERTKLLRRKVWYFLITLDFNTAYIFFCPLTIRPHSYDTKLPEYKSGISNIADEQLEKQTIASLEKIYQAQSKGQPLLEICVDLQNLHKCSDMVQCLNDFESNLRNLFGVVPDYFTDKYSNLHPSIKVLHFRVLSTLRLFIATIYYFLHMYYKYKGEHSYDFYFFRKMILIVFSEMNYFCSELFFVCDRFFDDTFTMTVSPIILFYTHIVAVSGLGFAIRLNCSLIVLNNENDTSSSSVASLKALESKNELFVLRKLKLNKLLSERYFYAWKTTKSNSFGYNMVYQTKLYNAEIELLKKANITWTERQQYELENIIPTDIPAALGDPGDIGHLCYYSNRSIDDADFRGSDLAKTVQTDNLWINFNYLIDVDPYSTAFPKRLPFDNFPFKNAVKESGRPATPKSEATSSYTDVTSQAQPEQKVPLVQPSPLDPPPILGGATPNELLDFNLFSTDWTIEDFYPLPNYE